MTRVEVDLLPDGPRARVMRLRASRRATTVALGLVLIGGVGAAASEAARSGAFERLEQARLAAAQAASAQESGARLAALVAARAAALRIAAADRNRVPMAAVLAAIADPLTDDAFLSNVRFVEDGDQLVVVAEVNGDDASRLAAAIRSHVPDFIVEAASRSELRLRVPRDRSFVVGVGADEGAEGRLDAR